MCCRPAQMKPSSTGGKDEYAVVEGSFVRRFPIAGGKTRQIQYKLKAGEAGWLLKLDKVVEY